VLIFQNPAQFCSMHRFCKFLFRPRKCIDSFPYTKTNSVPANNLEFCSLGLKEFVLCCLKYTPIFEFKAYSDLKSIRTNWPCNPHFVHVVLQFKLSGRKSSLRYSPVLNLFCLTTMGLEFPMRTHLLATRRFPLCAITESECLQYWSQLSVKAGLTRFLWPVRYALKLQTKLFWKMPT